MSLELVLLLAPAVLLFAALLLGRYPGERAIARARRGRLSRPRASAVVTAPRRAHPLLPRGGVLVGSAIAARPPPACG